MLMRTTLTLDDDIVQKIKERMSISGKTMKQMYNDLLRSALLAPRQSRSRARFEARVFQGRPGLQAGFSWDLSTADILNKLDETEFKNQGST